MKSLPYILVTLFLITACQSIDETTAPEEQILTLEAFDYFETNIPFSPVSYQNSQNHDEVAALGRILFYDKKLSLNSSISCASCHKQQHGFADDSQFSIGVRSTPTPRNSMTLANNAYQISHFWEGSEGNIEDNILNPISNHVEMGMRSLDDLVEKLNESNQYVQLFNEVFGERITEDAIRMSLTTFVASLITYNSKFDKAQSTNFSTFTPNELAGKDLFFGKAKCWHCHQGDQFSASWRHNTNIGLDLNYEDEGAGSGRFKVPTLRNIALTKPYMHDGRFETLKEVVEHYTSGVQEHNSLDWTLRTKIELTETEKEMLVEFLHTLTDYEMIADEKFSNPFK